MSLLPRRLWAGLPSALLLITLGVGVGDAHGQEVRDSIWVAPDGSRVLQQSLELPVSVEVLWPLFTTSEGVMSWAVPMAEVDFRLGGIWESSYAPGARPGDPGNIRNRFLAFLPYRMITLQAEQAPPDFPFPELLSELFTVVEFEPLAGGGTRVTLSGVGYRDGEGWDALQEHFAAGNRWTLEQLHARVTRDWELRGAVLEQGLNTPVPDAVVTLYQVGAGGGGAEPVATTVSDELGRYAFRITGSGRVRVGAEQGGLTSSLSPELAGGWSPVEAAPSLFLPSPLLMLAATCDLEAQPGAVVVGVLRDALSGVPIPGAGVEARWSEAGIGIREQVVETDLSGRYRICGVAGGTALSLRTQLLGRTGPWDALEVPSPALLLHDLTFSLATAQAPLDSARAEALPISGNLGDLVGLLLDALTGVPVPQAVIQLRGTSFQGVTGSDGSFAFHDLLPGAYTLEVRHLGYPLTAREVQVPRGKSVRTELRVAPQVIELEEIEVVARTPAEEVIRTTPFRRYVMAGETLALEEERGARLVEVLSRGMTGLRVREHYGQGFSALCIETTRRIQRLDFADTVPDFLRSTRDPGGVACAMVQVVVDGARLTDGDGAHVSTFLRSFPIAEVESVEYLPPTHATLQYGIGGNVANGVLVIYTRGKGPYRSPDRDALRSARRP
jgi:uncharacterized protein YndB with AHSA1/START domain